VDHSLILYLVKQPSVVLHGGQRSRFHLDIFSNVVQKSQEEQTVNDGCNGGKSNERFLLDGEIKSRMKMLQTIQKESKLLG